MNVDHVTAHNPRCCSSHVQGAETASGSRELEREDEPLMAPKNLTLDRSHSHCPQPVNSDLSAADHPSERYTLRAGCDVS